MIENNIEWQKFFQLFSEFPNNQISNFVTSFVSTYESNKSEYLTNPHICKVDIPDNSESSIFQNNFFLSVIVRTQGNRIKSLQQNFASLKNQTNQNFEIVLLCHKATVKNKQNLAKLLKEQEPDFKSKISVYYLEEGNRTAPLNYGFSVSKGQYIAVLDDDDVALENWVEEFYKASLIHNGKILHSFVEEQLWSFDLENNRIIKCKLDKQEYCEKFSIHSQLELNRCPINGLAFPSYAFKKLYITFDESLTTNEDWDFLMRTSFVTGVYDTEKVTAIYVRWKDQSNAYQEHSEAEWKENIRTLKMKFDSIPILYPAGEIKSQIRYEWKPINFYHLFKIYKRTLLLSIICPLTFFMIKKLNRELKENKLILKNVKNNMKEEIYKL